MLFFRYSFLSILTTLIFVIIITVCIIFAKNTTTIDQPSESTLPKAVQNEITETTKITLEETSAAPTTPTSITEVENTEETTVTTSPPTTKATTIAPQTTKPITPSTTQSGRIVYITPYGEKYHCSAICAGSNAIEQNYNDIKSVYEPCKKCGY